MPIIQELKAEYEKYVKINNEDDYSKACIIAGEEVMKALDEGKAVEDAHKLMYEMELTGFQAGVVAHAISHFHTRGEEFRVAWNDWYGVPKDTKGVVNPAMFTFDEE